MDTPEQLPQDNRDEPATRRSFLSLSTTAIMAGGLLAGYGALGYIAGKFLYLDRPRRLAWIFVAEAAKFKVNDTLQIQTPAGQTVTVTRRSEGSDADAFLALSTTCPHLGCRVHWEGQNNRFFCPCHNGVFDATGKATEGPPAEAGQSLPQFHLVVENGLIFIEAPLEALG